MRVLKYHKLWYRGLLICWCMLCGCGCGFSQSGILDRLEPGNFKITLYARVVDTDGNALKNAKVKFRIDKHKTGNLFNYSNTIIDVYSDNNGNIKIDNQIGYEIHADSVLLDGYSYEKRASDDYVVFFKKNNNLMISINGKPADNNTGNTAILKMRKIGELSYLRKGKVEMYVDANSSGVKTYVDFIVPSKIEPTAKRVGGFLVNKDLCVESNWDAKNKGWKFRFSSDKGGGVQVSNQLLYEAPVKGYLEFVEIGPNSLVAPFKYIYVSSRGGKMYTRIELHDVLNSKKMPFVYSSNVRTDPVPDYLNYLYIVVNPNGSRSFEEAKGLPFEIMSQLDRELEESFKKDPLVLPPKHDLKRWMETIEESKKSSFKKFTERIWK